MKATRRHDLQENELARSLGDAVQFARQNANWIIGGIVAVLVVLLLVWYVMSQRQEGRQKQWQRYEALSNAVLVQGRIRGPESQSLPPRTRQELTQLASETSQPNLAAWANVQIGYSAFEELTRRRADLEAADVDLLAGEARQAYERVIANYPAQAAAVGEAHMGLGKLAESLNDFDTARKQYSAVVAMEGKAQPLTISMARSRLSELGKLAEPVVFPASAPSTELPESPLVVPVTTPASGPAAAPATGQAK